MVQRHSADGRAHPRGTQPLDPRPREQPGRVPLLLLQTAAGNRAVSRMLAPVVARTVQRCGSEVHAGCPCADEPGEIPRQRAPETAPVTDQATAPVADQVAGGPAGTSLTSPRFVGDPVLTACLQDRARLSPGARGLSVAKVQQALVDLGHNVGAAGVDQVYGAGTAAAVRAFKRAQALGFAQFGDVGPGTMARLDQLLPGELPACDPDDVIVAGPDAGAPDTDRGIAEASRAPGGPLLGFKIPGVTCQVRSSRPPPLPRHLEDLPAAIRGQLTLRTTKAEQSEIDGAFQIFKGTGKQADSIAQTPIFTDLPPVVDLQQALINVAHTLNAANPNGLATGETITLNIGDVPANPKFGGVKQPGGIYRFTRFHLPGVRDEHMLIEFLAPSVLRQPPAGAAADKAAFDKAFQSFGHRLVGNYSPDEIRHLDQGLRLVGDRALSRAGNLRFDRSTKPKIGSEEGSYDPGTRTITLIASALAATATATGGFHYGQFTLNHEVGHALSDLDTGLDAEFNAAAKKGGPAVTPYGRTSTQESLAEAYALFTIDPNQLRAMRPAFFAVFNRRYRP